MKTTSIIVASASFFAALGLAMPAPASSETVQIVLKTGDGDSAIDLTVTINQLFSTADNPGASAGVGATIDDPTATCQAFSDNAGIIPLASPFTADTPASFSATSSCGTEPNLKVAVPIGAFFCSKSAGGLPSTGGSNVASTALVRVQVQVESKTFTQTDFPVDGSIVKFANTAYALSIVAATDVNVNEVSCQAFADIAAKNPVGEPATSAKEAILTNDRNERQFIGAFVCSA